MKVLGIESSCDETGVALVQHATATAAPRLLRARAAQPGRHAPGLRRRRARAGVARPHPARAAAGAAGAATRPAARSRTSTVVAYTRGPGSGRCAAGGRRRGRGAGRGAGQAAARRAPPRRASAVALPVGRPAALSLRRAAGLGRPHATDARRTASASTSCSARRSTTLPARPSTRAPSCSAWATRAGRRWRAWRSMATRGLCAAAPAAAQRRPRLLVCRPEDGGADAGAQAARHRALRTGAADLAAATQAAIVDVLVKKSLRALRDTGLSRLVVAGGVGANTRLREQLNAACAKLRRAGALPRAAPVQRQRRHDRPGRGDARAGRPHAAAARPHVRREAALGAREIGADVASVDRAGAVRCAAARFLASVSDSTPLSSLACDAS